MPRASAAYWNTRSRTYGCGSRWPGGGFGDVSGVLAGAVTTISFDGALVPQAFTATTCT